MPRHMYLMVLSMLAVRLTTGQVIHTGRCQDYPTKADFQLGRYVGTWYDIEKFYFLGMMKDRCVKAEYTDRHNGTVGVVNSGITPDDRVKSITGKAYYKDSSVKSKLTVQLADFPEGDYWVLDTDYATYSIVWSCRNLPLGLQADLAWILARNRTLEPAAIDAVKQKMQKLGIDTSSFTVTNQQNCF